MLKPFSTLSALGALLSPPMRIGISKENIAVFHQNAVSHSKSKRSAQIADYPLTDQAQENPKQLGKEFESILHESGCRHRSVELILSDDSVRLFLATPPINAGSLRDCRAAAMMRFQTLYGEPAENWQVEGDWDAYSPFLVCAIPKPLLSALKEAAANARCQLTSIAPHFIVTWNQSRQQLRAGAWLGILQGQRFSLAATAKRRIAAIRSTSVSPLPVNQEWLATYVQREALRLNLPMPELIQVCGLPGDLSSGNPTTGMQFEKLTNKFDNSRNAATSNAAYLLSSTARRST